jgi:translin
MGKREKRTLEEAVAHAEAVLKQKDELREGAFRDAREIQRAAVRVLRGGVGPSRSARAEAREQLELASAHSRTLRRSLKAHPDLYESGFLETPLQELAEAYILLARIEGAPVPTYDEIAVTPAAFLLGAADAIGEFRRHLVDAMRQGRIEDAEEELAAMERAYAALSGIALPDAIVPLRKKMDVARSLLERSRGEVALAVRMHEHARAIRKATRTRGGRK